MSLRLATVLLSFALLLPSLARAQEEPRKQLSDTVTAQLPALRTLTEDKNFPEALRLIDSLLPAVAEGSYDLTLLKQIKTQVLINQSRYAEAGALIEQVLAQGNRYLDAKTRLDQWYLLSQIHHQQAGETKTDAARLALLERASAALQKWFALNSAPTAEARLFSADLLYQAAIIPPLNRDKLQLTLTEAEKSLRLQIQPNPRAYVLILAVYQQLGDKPASAEILELLVSKKPESSNYWQQLSATYLGIAAETKDPEVSRNHTLRAVVTIERAQAAGQLRTPKDNLNLVALYFTLQQHGRATSLLEKGLASGTIENTRRNWELLAAVNQQANKIPEALSALERAATAFPNEGQLEFAVAQILYNEGRPEDALPRLEKAITKGGLDKPGQARLFLGYVAYELKHYEDALRWSQAATSFEDVKKDDLAKLTQAARSALHERTAPL